MEERKSERDWLVFNFLWKREFETSDTGEVNIGEGVT